MRRTLRCHICDLKMVVDGTPKGIQALAVQFSKDHRHGDRTDTSIATDEGYQMASLTAPGLFPSEPSTETGG